MEIWELKSYIEKNEIPTPLIFIGEEYKLMEIYINQIFKVKGEEFIRYEKAEDWVKKKNVKSIFEKKQTIACVKYDQEIVKSENEKLWDHLDGLILVFHELDKRKGFYKKFIESNIIEFKKMDEKMILQVLKAQLAQKNIKLDDKYINWLIETCNKDYGRCLIELDKILIFGDQANEKLFKEMAKNDIFHYDAPDNIFEFIDCFVTRKKDECFTKYKDIKEVKELHKPGNCLGIFTLLYNQLRNIILIQLTPNPTEESVGLTAKQIGFLKWKTKKYSDTELINMLIQLSETERKVKMGEIEELVGLEKFLCRWL